MKERTIVFWSIGVQFFSK